MPRHYSRYWPWIFAIATAIAYGSALRAPFVFDDIPGVRTNTSIRQLTPISIPLSPPANTSVSGRPVVNLSLALNYALHERLGVDPRGANATTAYHVVNLTIHWLCAVLLFAVVRRTLKWSYSARTGDDATLLAGFATLIWLAHPIHTSAVDYVIQRSELIVSACYLMALYASIRAWTASGASRMAWYATAVAACVVGMASKEVMATVPLVLVLYDRAFRADSWRTLARNRERVALYVMTGLSIAIVFLTVAANERGQSVGFDLGVRWYEYLYSQCWAITRYLRLLVWPNDLTFDYGQSPVRGWKGIPGALLLAVCGALTLLAWTRGRDPDNDRRHVYRQLGFLGAWFFVILAPSSSIIPIRTEIAAERRVYLASAAVVVLAVIGADQLRRRYRWGRAAYIASLSAVSIALVAASFVRGMTFASVESLYRDVIAKAPQNPRGYVGVGLALIESGPERAEEASALFRQATVVDSNYFAAWQVLGVMELARGQWSEAERAFDQALRLEPRNLDAAAGMARALLAQQRGEDASRYVDRLSDPDAAMLWSLGALLVEQGRGSLALKYLEPAASQQAPSLGLALLSVAYAQSARPDDAVTMARRATDNAGDTVRVYVLAGHAMRIAKRPREAREYLRRALVIDPGSALARRELAELSNRVAN